MRIAVCRLALYVPPAFNFCSGLLGGVYVPHPCPAMTNGVFPVPALQVRRLTEAAYLDTERTPYYRLIMRFFLEQAEAQVTWVKADDIRAHVRRAYDPLYDEAQRDRDLKFLAEKRNLLAVQDTRGARTAREFRNRKLEYHIRADALCLERFVRDLERNPAQGGSSDSSLLERLWTRLSELHGLLQEVPLGAEGVNSARAEALWPLWEDALTPSPRRSPCRGPRSGEHRGRQEHHPERPPCTRSALIRGCGPAEVRGGRMPNGA